MARSNVASKWISEYCAPVVSTISSPEVENICLRNGLLLHELLSAFGHLDGIHATIRSSTQMVAVSDAHIRFERSTEAKAKSPLVVEELLRSSFEEFDMARMPSTVGELKASVPSAWTTKMEQVVSHSMAFSEYEMISQPIVLLLVVSTSDSDPIACMQELCAQHHLPACLATGQYETTIHTVYLLLHDEFACTKPVEPSAEFRRFQTRFPPTHSKLLVLNSLSPATPNLHQPDMWSRGLIPLYYPNLAPAVDPSWPVCTNPVNGTKVLGGRLSMEDFMSIRDFCIGLYHQDIVPQLERRIFHLTKSVADARKGMKNVLKNFWRKPREEVSSRGVNGAYQVRYKADRIETQITLLADSCFMIKDYDTALSMYKLVREDYKSDKSFIHLANTNMMIAACYCLLEPGRKDLNGQLEQIVQSLIGCEPIHACAYFALLASEMMTMAPNVAGRAPLEAAQVLLIAANSSAKLPLLSGMLTERASGFLLQAGHARKFCLHQVLAGRKYHSCGVRPAKQALIHFACALLVHDKGHWGGIKAKLSKMISDDLKLDTDNQNHYRALLLMLRMVDAVLNTSANVSGRETIRDAVVGLRELMNENNFGYVQVMESWDRLSIYQILLGPIPVTPIERPIYCNSGHTFIEVCGLSVPVLNKLSLYLLQPINGYSALAPFGTGSNPTSALVAEELRTQLEVERSWGLEQELSSVPSTPLQPETIKTFPERIAEAEMEVYTRTLLGTGGRNAAAVNPTLRVPLGEKVILSTQLTNRLPIELSLSSLRLEMSPAPETFSLSQLNLQLPSGSNRTVQLTASPTKVGLYSCESLLWSLSDCLAVRQTLRMPGKLIQKTLSDRSKHARSEETYMRVEVVPPYPLLNISFEGLSPEVLQGQLLKATLILRNEGAAPACNVDLKLSQPCFVFYIENNFNSAIEPELVPLWGQSCTVVRLPADTVIAPGNQLRLCAWLRISDLGKQTISILTSYQAKRENGAVDPYTSTEQCRTSFVSVETTIIPSINVSARVAARPSSTTERILVVDVCNNISLPPVLPVPQLSMPPSATGRTSSWDNRSSLGHPFVDHTEAVRRFSSKGQIEFDMSSVEKDGIKLDEGQFKVEGVLIFGAANPTSKAEQQEKYRKLVIGSTESMVICVPVDFIDRSDQSNLIHSMSSRVILESNWALSLSESIGKSIPASATGAGTGASDGRHVLTRIVERFLCIATANDSLQRSLRDAREQAILESMEASAQGPRTISQVRKDRAKEGTDLMDVSLDDVIDEDIDTNAASNTHSASCRGVPLHIHDLALSDLSRCNTTVVVVWSCRWQEKLRTGMHFLSNLSLFNNATAASVNSNLDMPLYRAPSSSLAMTPADGLLVCLSHASSVTLPQTDSSVVIPVVVELRSVKETTLYVTIEAIDRRTPSTGTPLVPTITIPATPVNNNNNSQLPPSGLTPASVTVISPSAGSFASSNTSASTHTPMAIPSNANGSISMAANSNNNLSANSASLGKSNRSAPKGLRWEGKTKFVGISVAPHSSRQLVFSANISRSGVFDLKRFKILVSIVDPKQQQAVDNTSSVKNIPGQSLIEVFEPSL